MRAILLFMIAACASVTNARDIWVVMGSARGPVDACSPVHTWLADAYLHNVGLQAASVKVIDTSNGGGPVPIEATVFPQQAVALSRLFGERAPRSALYVTHLTVGDSILAEGRLEYSYDFPCSTLPPLLGPVGKGLLPVFTELQPPLVTRMHFGTDLALQKARINVGIYNDGDITALATVETRRPGCLGAASERQSIQVPPKSIIQTTVRTPTTCSAGDPLMPTWEISTTVMVDQRSFSYVTVVSNEQPPVTSFALGTSGK
jgi:hypothetical protein